MEVHEQQLASAEQEVVLSGLAQAVARTGCNFLEVGTWYGDSAVILGRVARKHGGHLFCVDWWRGNADTQLADIARREDVFSIFWQRMCREGLDDVVVPIRGPSQVAAQVLRPGFFDLVFLDADHRYDGIRSDIRAYAPLVNRSGGILCGHDCEGRLADYDAEFLQAGKDLDIHETVHCGVVCAVGEAFADCSLDHSIWSVRASAPSAGWEPTNLAFPGIPKRRQTPPPPIATTKVHNLLRYGKRIYVVPHSMGTFDVSDESQRNLPEVRIAWSRREAEELCRTEPEAPPQLVEEGYLGFNIVRYAGRFYALAQDIGPIDLPELGMSACAELERSSRMFVANSHEAVRAHIDRVFRRQRGPALEKRATT